MHIKLQALAACLVVGLGFQMLYQGLEVKSQEPRNVAAKEADLKQIAASNEITVGLLADEEQKSSADVAPLGKPTEERSTVGGYPSYTASEGSIPKWRQETGRIAITPGITVDSTVALPSNFEPKRFTLVNPSPKAESKNSESVRILPAGEARALIGSSKAPDFSSSVQTRARALSEAPRNYTNEATKTSNTPARAAAGIFETLSSTRNGTFARVAEEPLSVLVVNPSRKRFEDLKTALKLSETRLRPSSAELTNAFQYHYASPQGEDAFAITTEVASCPWEPRHRLVLLGIQASKLGDTMAANGVSLRVDFNPLHTVGYRLLSDDMRPVDSTDVMSRGCAVESGATITVLYEIIPSGQPMPQEQGYLESKYQPREKVALRLAQQLPSEVQRELLTATLRYRKIDDSADQIIEKALIDGNKTWKESSPDFRWAAAASGMAQILHEGGTGSLDFELIRHLTSDIQFEDPDRLEFVKLLGELN